MFFAQGVLVLSKRNWSITIPMVVLAIIRLGASAVSTVEMICLRNFHLFVAHYAWVFTLGLVASAMLDILVTASLCWYLSRSRSGIPSMNHVIDEIMLYTINNGILTCLCTVVSLTCWIRMPHNLVFLGIHFAICKLCANSFMATLNTRESLREKAHPSAERPCPLSVLFPDRRKNDDCLNSRTTKLEINVAKTMECRCDAETDLGVGKLSNLNADGPTSEFTSNNHFVKQPVIEVQSA